MRLHPFRCALAASLLLAALSAASARADRPEMVAALRDRTPISAYGQHLVWSERRAGQTGFVLVDLVNSVRHVLRVPARAVPFDVDVGPDGAGRAVAVYSRCHHESWSSNDFNSGLVAYGAPTQRDAGCDLYQVTLPSGREHKLRRLSQHGPSETLPTIWGNTIAFVRVNSRRHGVAGVLPHLFYARGQGRPREIRGGSRGVYAFHGYLNGDAVADGGPGPLQLDLRGNVLAFSWNSLHNRCNGVTDDRVSPEVQEVWRVNLGVSRRLIARACQVGVSDAPSGVYAASLGPQQLSYFAKFPMRAPEFFVDTWSPDCSLASASTDAPGRPVGLTTSETDRYLLMQVEERSFQLWRVALSPVSPC